MIRFGPFVLAALVLIPGCGRAHPGCKPGELYSITAGTARPGSYMVCKVLVIDEHGVWVSMFKDVFDHRPTGDEALQQSRWVPMVFEAAKWDQNEPKMCGFVHVKQEELDHLERTRPEVLKWFRPR